VEEAHALKGAVANLQAEATQEAARRMEKLGRAEAFEKAPDALEELQNRVDRLRDALEEIVQDLD
jgi:HPt (histidine-containing phosphotransfer) domain-containing protein